MLFNQIEFIIFFIIFLPCYYCIRNNTIRNALILVASYYFFIYWDYRVCMLILVPTLSVFAIALAMNKYSNHRKFFLFISVVINISILGFFKYFNFFISSFSYIFHAIGIKTSTINIIVPLGISFYTFRVLSYTIDVYRKKISPCRNLLHFAVFLAFFPVILAGPLVRGPSLLPQLQKTPSFTRENFHTGIKLFIMGLFQKVFVADRLAPFVNHFWENHAVFDSPTTWLAVFAYTLQIYCDFAGYSNMAIGVGKMMGFELGVNFNFPYLATSVQEFWRRWHISLSEWIRDYLYFPLGGSRQSNFTTYRNLLVAMTLCGLWHGAAWTFAFWGTLHGIALAINRFPISYSLRFFKSSTYQKVDCMLSWLSTMMLVSCGWVFFRSSNFLQALSILRQMLFPSMQGVAWHPPFVLFALAGAALLHIMKAMGISWFNELPEKAWYSPTVILGMAWLVVLYYPIEFAPFIYAAF